MLELRTALAAANNRADNLAGRVATLLQAAAANKGVVRIDSFRDTLGAKREEFSAMIRNTSTEALTMQASSSRGLLAGTRRKDGGGGMAAGGIGLCGRRALDSMVLVPVCVEGAASAPCVCALGGVWGLVVQARHCCSKLLPPL